MQSDDSQNETTTTSSLKSASQKSTTNGKTNRKTSQWNKFIKAEYEIVLKKYNAKISKDVKYEIIFELTLLLFKIFSLFSFKMKERFLLKI
jgi:hypothetical protein